MIEKVVQIKNDIPYEDSVKLSWFDMHKPNLSAVSQKGVSFMLKVSVAHLHEGDILVCEGGHTIKIELVEDDICELKFTDITRLAFYAYEVGNRHQPIYIESSCITVLKDVALEELIHKASHEENIQVTLKKGYFKPNGKAYHSH